MSSPPEACSLKLSNMPIVRHFRRFVKPRHYASTNHPILTNYSLITRSLALSLALISDVLSQVTFHSGMIIQRKNQEFQEGNALGPSHKR
jgi:hypothetical protein